MRFKVALISVCFVKRSPTHGRNSWNQMAPWRSTGLTLTQRVKRGTQIAQQLPAQSARHPPASPSSLSRSHCRGAGLTVSPPLDTDAPTALGGFNATTRGASNQEPCWAVTGTQRGGSSRATFILQAQERGPCLPGTCFWGLAKSICRHFLGQQNSCWIQQGLEGSSPLMGTPASRAEILGAGSVPGSPLPPIKSAALPTKASVRGCPHRPRCDSEPGLSYL